MTFSCRWKSYTLENSHIEWRFGFVHELSIHRGGLHGYNSERFGNEKRNGQLQPTSRTHMIEKHHPSKFTGKLQRSSEVVNES